MKREVKKVLACCLILAMCLCNLSVTTITSQAATKKATAITLNAKKKALTVGKKYQLKVKKVKPSKASKSVTWKSSNNKVAKVSSKGKVTAKKAGKATITAISKTNKKVKATCKITVYSKPTKVSLNYGSREIKTGESFNLKATVSPKKAKQTVTYSSSNKKVATVNKSGKVTGKTAGKATITVISTTNKSKKAKCVVYVSGGVEATATPTATTAPTITDSAAVTDVPTATPNPLVKTGITRAEWVTALLQAMDCQVEESNLEKDENGTVVYHFSDIESSEYATEIETAAIFGYIESGDGIEMFQPETGVTREYAVMTAVNALGVSETDEIVCDDSSNITYKTQANYAVAENMVSLENGKFNPDRILTKEEQTQLLNRLAQIRQERSAQAIITPVIEYTENVVVPETESEEGYTVTTLSEEIYQVQISESSLTGYGISKEKLEAGEILVLPSTAEAPSGMTLAIEGVEEISGVYTITGAVPSDISQVYERIQVSGTADASTQTIEPEYGVTVEEVNGEKEIVISEEAINASLSGGTGELYSKEASFSPNDYVSGKITFKIPNVSYYIDAELSLIKGIKVNQISLTMKENVNVETTLKGSVSGSIPVGETTIPIKEIPGLAIKAKVTLEYSASGKVNFVFHVDAKQTIGVKDNALFKETPKPSVTDTLTIEAEGKVGAKLAVSLVWPSFIKKPSVLFDANTDFGIGIKGNSVTHGSNNVENDFCCVDGKIYFYLNASLITKDCILYDLYHKDWKIFTESNSPIRKNGHWENGTKVEKCTWKAKITPTIAPDLKPTNAPEATVTPGNGGTAGGGNYAGLSGPRTDAEGNVTYDCVYFGRYPQSNATGQMKEPIKWRILSVNGTDAFLIADQNLDVYRYNEEVTNVTWETSTIRSWLNGYGSTANAYGKDYSSDNFIERAFTDAEQAAIPYVSVVNEDNPEFGTEGGNDTQDRIYLLSISEVSNAFYGFLPYHNDEGIWIRDNARQRTNTVYVAAGGSINSESMDSVSDTDGWWLRSPGDVSYGAAYVSYGGSVEGYSDSVLHDNIGVCPVLHLNLSSTDVWSNAGTVTIENDGGIAGGGSYAGLSGPRIDAEGNVTYDCVYFGSYPQSDATGKMKEPIKWRILSVNGTDAFLIADKNLDVYRYNEEDTDVTWATSTIRSWLNGYGSTANAYGKDYSGDNFIGRAFNIAEQAAIPYVSVVNEDNPEYGIEGGNHTQDKIYLLSIAEASNKAYGFISYKNKDVARERINTAYATGGGSINSENVYLENDAGAWCWWLRTQGYHGNNEAITVDYDGRVDNYNSNVDYNGVAVCPVLHLELSYKNVWSNAGTVTIRRATEAGKYTELSNPRIDAEGNVKYDCVYFGRYPQYDGETEEAIKWRILSINGMDAFLIADQNLDVYRYNEEDTDVTWETSTIRSWLNGYGSTANAYGKDYSSDNFIGRAFNVAEQAAIPYVSVVNEDNPEFGTEGGNDTQDRIYLLSISEMSNASYGFLPCEDEKGNYISDRAKGRSNTGYVYAGGTIQSSYICNYSWLRSSGHYSDMAGIFTDFAGISGNQVSHENAVCPALHLNLSSTDVWSNAGTVTIERY